MDTLGQGVLHDPEKTLPLLKPYANDSNFRERFALQRQRNKDTFTSLVKQRLEIDLDPNALFDVQIKRIHEYKRS